MLFKICFYLAALYCVSASVLLVEKCKLSDSACLKSEFQKGVPVFMNGIEDLGVEALDVMNMYDFKFDLSGLQFSLSDGKLKGLKDSVIESVNWDTKKQRFEVVFHLDCVVKGHYTAGGRILILPITGDGQLKLKLKKTQIKLIVDYDLEKRPDGKDYMTPKKLDFDFDVIDNANFQLTNLFNGNKELSDAMLTFMNDNWKQISVEFGRPMVEVTATTLFRNVKNFFKNVPLSDLAEY